MITELLYAQAVCFFFESSNHLRNDLDTWRVASLQPLRLSVGQVRCITVFADFVKRDPFTHLQDLTILLENLLVFQAFNDFHPLLTTNDYHHFPLFGRGVLNHERYLQLPFCFFCDSNDRGEFDTNQSRSHRTMT